MPIIDTSTLSEGVTLPENEQIYNGLDCCITHEVLEQLRALGPAPRIYNFTRALQAPVLDMMRRGFLIDTYERQKGIETLEKERERLLRLLNRFAYAVWDAPLNANSPQMLKAFFYDAMHLPEVWTSKKGERKLSLDREALEKLDNYFHARPLVSTILAIRDVTKQLSVLRTEVDSDGRMRTSYNVAGTECISGDSLVWTKSGLREIKDIYEATKPCAVWNGTEFVLPSRKVKYEHRDGFAIVLENGYELKCSSNHPLLTQDGWKEAQHLSISDTIQINVGLTEKSGQACLPSNSILPLLSEDFCEFIGMWLADGSLNSTKEHYRCRLSNSSPQVLIHFAALTKRLFNIEANLYENEVCFSSKKVAQWLASLGLPADSGLGSATIKVIPKCILRGTPNLLRALLRGLTLDSHLTDKGLMYGTQSLKMQDQIQQCLLTLGLTSSKLKTGNSIKLNVNRASCGRFLGMIGFVEPEKAKALAVSLNWRGQWHEPYSFGQKPYLQIKSITSWKGDVYDLSMPETSPPQYVAQGFTIHNTGRFSSSTNAFGSGTNLQNISSNLRKMFVADRGYKLCGIDLEQAESREVGWLSGTICGDWSYLDACYSGDLHTLVARTAWPELPWTGDPKSDRGVAETPFYRHLTYRDMAKKLGHGCLTSDHEVLTRDGWVPITSCPREILAFNESYSDFEPVSRWTDFPYSGTLHSFEGTSISAEMTSDHRVPFKSDQRSPMRERRADQGPGAYMPLGFGFVGGHLCPPARLIAAFMADGHQHTKNSMKFHFHKKRKINRLIELCEHYEYPYRIALPYIYVEGCLPKDPGWWMLEWSEESLADFLDEYKHWDGHVSATAQCLFSKHREHLEIIQTLGRICGIGGNIQRPYISGFGSTMYKLQQNRRKWATGKCVTHTRREVENERVLCPTVPSSFFYVRRNGKIFVTGNSNYRGLPPTMAKHAKIPVQTAEQFQYRYFKQFPGIPKWHRHVAQQLQTSQSLTTPLGRQRTFFGRAHDDTTLREAIAFSPQSATADRMNLILWRIWKYMPHVQLLGQVHDAIYLQFSEKLDEQTIIAETLSHFHLELQSGDHKLIVPGEAKVGWNWGNFHPETNPDGLKKWKEGQKDDRKRTPFLQQKL